MSFIAAKIINPIYEVVCCLGLDTCEVSLFTEADVLGGVWLVGEGGQRQFPASSERAQTW